MEILTEAKNTHMEHIEDSVFNDGVNGFILYTSPSPRDRCCDRMPSYA